MTPVDVSKKLVYQVPAEMSKLHSSTNVCSKLPFLLITLSTFNLRGLGNDVKQSHLDQDCLRYDLDIVALQETKVKEYHEHVFPESHNKLVLFDQKSCWQRGIGFLISKRMVPCVIATKQISDNVAYIDIEIQRKSGIPA